MNTHTNRGFTIVELLIVIVVIGILAAITLVAFSGIRDRAAFAQEKSDMAALNKLIKMYHSDNGSYPIATSWVGWDQAPNFIPGIVPTYASSIPQMPTSGTNSESYLYMSSATGSEYKLIRYSEAAGLPSVQRTNNDLLDVNPSRVNRAWGYWSAGAASF